MPAGEAMKARNFLARAWFLLVFGMYAAPGSQIVAPAFEASSPGMPKNPIFGCWSFGIVPTTKVSIGYCAPLPVPSSFKPWARDAEP